jgi:hypothetical protein
MRNSQGKAVYCELEKLVYYGDWGEHKKWDNVEPVQFCKMEQDGCQKTASLQPLYSQVPPRAEKCRKIFSQTNIKYIARR